MPSQAPTAAPSAEARSSHLLEWRERAGLTLQHIAENTKISVRFLHAIEAGNLEQLPGGIYTLSYLRQYAEAIGYDESKLLTFYGLEPARAEAPEPPARGLFGRWLGAFSSVRF